MSNHAEVRPNYKNRFAPIINDEGEEVIPKPKGVAELLRVCDECDQQWLGDRIECPICGHDWQKVAQEVEQAIEDSVLQK